MNITIDTSVLIAVITGEASRRRAIELTAGQGLVAPGSVHWEVGNALSAMIKRGRINAKQANACIHAYADIAIRRLEVDLKKALALAEKHRIYAYDAYLLVCALQTDTPLLSLDRPLQAVAESLGITVLEI